MSCKKASVSFKRTDSYISKQFSLGVTLHFNYEPNILNTIKKKTPLGVEQRLKYAHRARGVSGMQMKVAEPCFNLAGKATDIPSMSQCKESPNLT